MVYRMDDPLKVAQVTVRHDTVALVERLCVTLEGLLDKETEAS